MVAIPRLAYSTVEHRLKVNLQDKVKITRIVGNDVYAKLDGKYMLLYTEVPPMEYQPDHKLRSILISNDKEYYQYLDNLTKNLYDKVFCIVPA